MVPRRFGTQDAFSVTLVRENYVEISDTVAANAFLPGFSHRDNAKFAKVPRRADNLNMPVNIEPDDPRNGM